jgi:DNA-binding XRE family transcriptional regulator
MLPSCLLLARPKERRDDDQRRRTAGAPRMNWGVEIRKIREGQGLSQRRQAKLANVDRASMLRFEKGDSRGNLDMVGQSSRCILWSSAAKSVQSIAELFRPNPAWRRWPLVVGCRPGNCGYRNSSRPIGGRPRSAAPLPPLHPLSERDRSQG